MRTIEDIIADTLKVTELSLSEAFDAGRASAAADLKLKLTTFVSELVAPFDMPASSAPSVENQPASEPSAEHQTEEQAVGEHTAEHHEGGEHHQDGHYN